jgi:hypothetical protein
MQLVLVRDQSKGLLGGVKFEVRAQVRLSEEERKLIQHYKLENEVVLQKPMLSIWGAPTDVKLDIRVRQLIDGDTFKCKDLGEVLAYADNLKSACETLKGYLEAARHFGGQEVVEI